MLCHSTGRGNRRSAESLYRSRGSQSWSHPGGPRNCSQPSCLSLRKTHTVPPDAQQLFFSFSAGQRRIRLFKRDADCRLRNVTAASSHCVLTANRTAFHFLSRNFHHFLSPLPTRHQHLTMDTFITSGSFFSRGNKLPAPAAASTGKSSGNRRRETQTVKIVSDERSAPVLLSSLKLQRLLFSQSVFFFFFVFPMPLLTFTLMFFRSVQFAK